MADFRWVSPGELRLSPTRPEGADNYKLAMQVVEYGSSTEGMPPIEVIVGKDGEMIIFNGVTRATRAYQYHPNDPVLVEVTDVLPDINMNKYRTISEASDEPTNDE